jgi:lysophospholipase L1-like esterase
MRRQLSARDAKAWPGTTAALRFGGAGSVTVPPGAEIASDPVALATVPREKLAVIVHLGANDIRDTPGDPCLEPGGPATAAQVIDAHQDLIRAARARGLKVIGTTILPMKGALFPVWTPQVEKERDAVNHWIRTSGAYDAVLDADRILADPADPDRPRFSYVYEDGLHSNDAGFQALARGITLTALR